MKRRLLMGNRGPAAKPTALKVLEGNPGKRPLPKGEPQPGNVTRIKPPSYLPPLAKKEWRVILPQLQSLGLISDLDIYGLAAYCNAYATWVDALGQIKKTGALVRSPNGYPMPSPWIKISRDAQDEMMRWLKEFGMTPAARSRVSVEGGDDEPDELEKLFREAAND
jgi:P27 family predicted phage terminase small subunit